MRKIHLTLFLTALLTVPAALAQIDDAADLFTQQAQEKRELERMKREMNSIRGNIKDALQSMDQVKTQIDQQKSIAEVKLQVKDGPWEILPSILTNALTFNGQTPGPEIRVKEGQPVKVVVQNSMRVPTSLTFHGVLLPHTIGGLPRKGQGLIEPGQSYVYQFYAPKAGTYWYHPQVMHADQMAKGLYGALIVEPAQSPKTYDRDFVFVLGQAQVTKQASPTAPKSIVNYFTVNGKSAPSIPPVELNGGEKVRLRLINAAGVDCPLFLTGHQFEVVSSNGADSLEPRVTRDTLTLHPGDRVDLELTANNPGVWSLASLLPSQTNNDGKFPGGLAVVVRYPDAGRGNESGSER